MPSLPRVISIIMGVAAAPACTRSPRTAASPPCLWPATTGCRHPDQHCLNSGINQIFVLTQFNTASLHKHIQQTYKFDGFGRVFVDILAAEQTGTRSPGTRVPPMRSARTCTITTSATRTSC